MPGDVSHHRLIARPPGLPGYQPGRWCAVCGKTTSNRTIIDCSSGDCPNTSHTNCLGDNSTFDCCEVSALRTAQGITSPVVYQVAAAEPPEGGAAFHAEPFDVPAADDDDDDLDDLLQLDPRELVENIRQLRKELKRKKNILSFFEATSQTLAEKRDAVVTVLDLIDNICATRSSAEELDTRSIAATAKPHRIDEEWDRQVASSDVTANWWKSGKPRPLQSTVTTTTINPSGSRHLHSPQTTIIPSKGASTATETVAAPKNYRNTRVTENYKNNKTHTRQSNKSLLGNTVTPRPSPRNQSRDYCKTCGRNGHTENNCLRRNKCTHCLRVGHTAKECRTRIAQEREENFLRKISTEQAQNNALLVQSLSRLLPPAPHTPGPALPQPLAGNWAPGHQTYTPHPQPFYPAHAHPYTLQPLNPIHTAWGHARP